MKSAPRFRPRFRFKVGDRIICRVGNDISLQDGAEYVVARVLNAGKEESMIWIYPPNGRYRDRIGGYYAWRFDYATTVMAADEYHDIQKAQEAYDQLID